jgi:hypothetical protein
MLSGEKCIRCHQHFKFEELTAGPDGYGICASCASQLAKSKEQLCPNDHNSLARRFIGEFLVGTCDLCNGVWIDGAEIERLRKELDWFYPQLKAVEFVRALLGDHL